VRVTAVGDCGVDRYLNLGRDRPGGITLNFAANARRIFPATDAVGVVTALGTDREAVLVRRAIEGLGLDACLVEREGATSIQYIDRHRSGEKIFVRYEQGVLGDYRVGAREREVIARSDLLMAVLYAQVEDFFDSVMGSPSPGLRAVDFGDLAGLTGPRVVERYREAFHVGFFGLTAADGALIDELEAIARRQRQLYVVTLGPDGSVALGREQRLECPATPVAEVVDTTGAGDTFAAGFLGEYCVSRNVARSLARGAEEAAACVKRVGAFPWED